MVRPSRALRVRRFAAPRVRLPTLPPVALADKAAVFTIKTAGASGGHAPTRRALLFAIWCVFILAVALVTFLELALTLLVKVGPGGYTGEDDDHTAWLHLMPWTIGL